MYSAYARRSTFTAISIVIFVLALAAPSFAAIHAGDTLYVKVWNHPELSKQVVVDADGGVRIPLSGVVPVGGLDEKAAATKLAVALKPYVVFPAVSIETVAQGTTLFVSGGPGGVLKYQPGETLSAAIADVMQSTSTPASTLNNDGQNLTQLRDPGIALRARIDLRNVKIERDGQSLGPFDTVALGLQGDPGPALEPGDTIAFAYKPIAVRVSGEVTTPGMTYLSADQSLSEALAQAGGLMPSSVTNNIILERAGSTHAIALGDPVFASPAQNGDVIVVPEAPHVNVVGTVTTPGVVALKTDSTLLSALYTAGGPTKDANLHDVQVVRNGKVVAYDVTELTHGDVSQNPTLQDGDTVVVPLGHKIDPNNIFTILGGIAAGLASRVPL